MPAGAQFYLLRLGRTDRGIIGGGQTTSIPSLGPHWDRDRAARDDEALAVDVRFVFLRHEALVGWDELNRRPLDAFTWSLQKSGARLPDDLAKRLAALVEARVAGDHQLPEELKRNVTYPEGAKRIITVNAYERHPAARAACIAHYGTACAACGIDLGDVYGPIAFGFIHVHHVVPVSKLGRAYRVDPIKDLRPICPNCHAVAHLADPPIPISTLRKRVRERRGLTSR